MRGQLNTAARADATIDLYWLPLGAGGHFVRWNGRAYEAMMALRERRRPQELYHSALVAKVEQGDFVIEMTPIRDAKGGERGVVAEGPVGSRLAGHLRLFRYELRRWNNGVIPRCRRGSRQSGASQQRRARRPPDPRTRDRGADACVGSGRTSRW